jgi:hypothetical protein
VPGRWRQKFKHVDPPPGSKRLYMACRLIITLPVTDGGPDVEAVYEDGGEMDGASRAGLKALDSDARKRPAAAAGIGAYLYTALEPVVLPIGRGGRQLRDRELLSRAARQLARADTQSATESGEVCIPRFGTASAQVKSL